MARWLPSGQPTPFPVGGATCLVLLLAWSVVWPELPAQAPEQEHVVTALKNMGGQVQRDPKAPGQPVIGLNLSGTRVTNADLALLKPLQGLRTLILTQIAITDAGLQHIEPLLQLRGLFLPVNITDAWLVHVKGLIHLEHLTLRESQVFDAGLVHLKGLQILKSLGLHGTKVTDAGLRDIQQALPRASINR